MRDIETTNELSPLYKRIYTLVELIPPAQVATYGQIAEMVTCSPRVVGYAMAAVPEHLNLPWHRVINSQGKVSVRSDGAPSTDQRQLLQDEGVAFDKRGRVNFDEAAWHGPEWDWLQANDYNVAPPAGYKRSQRA